MRSETRQMEGQALKRVCLDGSKCYGLEGNYTIT